MLEYPDIDPILFDFGLIKVRWYGLMYVIGFVLAFFLARRRAARSWTPLQPAQVDDLIFYCMLGVIIGGRLGYCFVYGWDQLTSNPLYIFKITEGGMSFHGGLVGVMGAVWLYARRLGRPFWELGDFVAPLAPLGLGFGRIGNFINGELWGKPTDVPWSFNVNGQALHPSQLYEAALEGFVLFAIVWFYSARPRPAGAVSGVFLIGYGVARSIVEFYRVPDEHLGYLFADWVTMGQLLSLPMIALGALLLLLARSKPAETKEAS